MARMVGDKGHVTAVDHIPQLINLFMTKLKISYPKLYKLYKIMDVVGKWAMALTEDPAFQTN